MFFIDEIHRFNKGQQDYLLPFVEDGTIILIGATTENPYFEVNGALLSRSVIFELKPLEKEDIHLKSWDASGLPGGIPFPGWLPAYIQKDPSVLFLSNQTAAHPPSQRQSLPSARCR